MAISPRSSNYERLERGHGPSNGQSKFTWKRLAIGAVVIISMVYFFNPRALPGLQRDTPAANEDNVLKHVDSDTTVPRPQAPPVHDEDVRLPPKTPLGTPLPKTFKEDVDPSKTVQCTTAAKGLTTLVQYAIMIDAGSTGSRIHVYKFNNCASSPTYEYESFEMTKPGLSSYKGDPQKAAESLDVLLKEALRVIPSSLHKCTPMSLKATAGLRLLGATDSGDILKAVEKHLTSAYPFQLVENGVTIMDGKDEGVYAWITANYLLETIRADTPKDTPSYAVLDLGGASTQIVFEPKFAKSDASLAEGEHKYELSFGGNTYILYQHSYLGYGLMHARKHVHRLVDFMSSIRKPSNNAIGNPCLAVGTERLVEIEDEVSGVKRNVTMKGGDVGGFEACNRIIQLVMAKDAICELKPCSFDGVYQPSLMDTFPSGKVLLLSYFYDRIQPLLARETSKPKITVSTIATLAKDVCQGKPSWIKHWGDDAAAMAELEHRPEYCLDLTFMHALLRMGYEFGDEREVAIGKQIGGTELGWCLGATIALIGGDLKCRI